MLSNSRGRESLLPPVEELGDGAFAGSLPETATQETVVAAGGLGTPEQAEQALDHADMISVGKMALSNAEWVAKVQSGQPLNAGKNPQA